MKASKYIALSLLLAISLVLVGCPEKTPLEPVVNTGSADFTTTVALGNSLTAGFTDGALGEFGQNSSFPKQIADMVGASFRQPLLADPGIGSTPGEGRLVLMSLSPLNVVPTPLTVPPAQLLQVPPPYNNLAVPGDNAEAVLNAVSGGLNDLILQGRGTQVQQAVAANPTFIFAWVGSDDVLGAALSGTVIDGVTMTPTAAFQQAYTAIIDALSATGAQIVVANVPDVTVVPFVTTLPPVVVNPATQMPVLGPDNQPIPLLGTFGDGSAGPLSAGDYVLLTAADSMKIGIGIPQAVGGTGQPLPSSVILDRDEVAAIQNKVDELNNVIDAVAGAKSIPVVNARSVLNDIKQSGYEIGGIEITTDFVTGGLFGLDGFHPTPLGYGVTANAFIEKINVSFGASIPAVNLRALANVDIGTVQKRVNPFEVDPGVFDSVVKLYTERVSH